MTPTFKILGIPLIIFGIISYFFWGWIATVIAWTIFIGFWDLYVE